MAKRKEPSPSEKDLRRWAELINEPDVIDFKSFDKSWDKFFADNPVMLKREDLKQKTFNELKEFKPEVAIPIKKEIKVKVIPKKKPIRQFKYRGRIKKRLVKIRETVVTVRGKRQLRYRDRTGKFAKKI